MGILEELDVKGRLSKHIKMLRFWKTFIEPTLNILLSSSVKPKICLLPQLISHPSSSAPSHTHSLSHQTSTNEALLPICRP